MHKTETIAADSGRGSRIFSATEISRALGISSRAVRSALTKVPIDGMTRAGGRNTKAWSVANLPLEYRERLKAFAAEQGFETAEAMLADSGHAALSLAEIAPEHVEKALKVRKALWPMLEMMDRGRIPMEEITSRGVAEYKRAVGHVISERHWRRLLRRTIRRDGGRRNWARLELYLDEKISRRPVARTEGDDESLFSELHDVMAGFKDFNRPSLLEKALVWVHTFECIEETAAAGAPESALKEIAVRFLTRHAPFLAKNEDALRRSFRRKFKAWRESGGSWQAVKDDRSENAGRKAPRLSEWERKRFLARIKDCGGRIDQAFREMWDAQEFSADVVGHYRLTETRKRFCPKSLREQIKYDAALVMDWAHGPHCAKMRGPYILRKHDHASGDSFQADDLTCPIYCWDEDAPRRPCRPQILLMIDTRSTLPLNFVLIMNRAYNGTDCRGLMTGTHDAYGLPRKRYYFERGVWKSKLVTEPKWDSVEWEATEVGFRDLGIHFRHAREARAKVIERVQGLMQNQMERDMAYAGRDERHDRFERLEKHLRLVRSGKAHPAEFFPHRDELCNRVEEICRIYSNEKQYGKILKGLSPAQAFQEFFAAPLLRLSAETRFVLASYKRRLTVGANGISFTFHNETFNYRSAQTGRLRGKEVVAWFNPLQPELLSVTDLEEEIPFTVERCEEISAEEATAEELETAHAQCKAHSIYGRRLYRAVAQEFPEDFASQMVRHVDVSPEAKELGEHMAAQRAAVSEARKRREREEQRAKSLARKFGITVPDDKPFRPGQAEALQRLVKALTEDDAETPAQEARRK